MHEMTPEHVHEEISLIAVDFSGMQFETMAPMPTWRDFYRSHDQRPHYAYLKKILQVLQWLRGGERWVLKSPQHLEQFPALVDTFPDATSSHPPRSGRGHPVARDDDELPGRLISTPSTRTGSPVLGPTGWRPCCAPASTPGRCSGRPFHRRALRQFMTDDVGMVERVYAVAVQPFTPAVRGAMEAFMAENQRGRHAASSTASRTSASSRPNGP